MLSEQIKQRLREAVTAAVPGLTTSPTARLAPMMLRAIPPTELEPALGNSVLDISTTIDQTKAIAGHPGAEAVRLLQAAILEELARGHPVTPEAIASRTGLSVTDVTQRLRHAAEWPGLELDPRGRVLGLGLSLVDTRHQVYLRDRGQVLYAWCAPDALLLPSRVSRQSRVVSPCFVTSRDVTIELGPAGVEDIYPDDAVLSFMAVIDPGDMRASGCDHQNLFASPDAAAEWLDGHPGGFVLPLADAHELLTHLRDG